MGELMQEISRTKKELSFANKSLYNKRVQNEGAGSASTTNFQTELNNNSIKLVESLTSQKKLLEAENEELKSRMNELMNDRTSNLASVLDHGPMGGA